MILQKYSIFSVQLASENEIEPPLPGFESFTPQQMFWISYGQVRSKYINHKYLLNILKSIVQVWCIKYRDAALKEHIETAPHAPGRFRILGPLSNNDAFAKDFNCPLGSGMNPRKKCEVW